MVNLASHQERGFNLILPSAIPASRACCCPSEMMRCELPKSGLRCCRCHDEEWQQTEPISTVQSFNYCRSFYSHKIEHSMSTTVFFRRCLPLPRRRWLPPRVSGRLPSPAATAAHFSTLLRRQYLLKARCSLIS